MALLVRCTLKGSGLDPYTKIMSVGGTRRDGTAWTCTVAAAIEQIQHGTETYYVNVNGFTPNLVVAVHKGTQYLKAPFDPDVPATLLGLPDCEGA